MSVKEPPKNGLEAKIRCIVVKRVTMEAGTTEKQARTNPWDHAHREIEDYQEAWEVLDVYPVYDPRTPA